jgi:hypothetical protein
LCELVVALELVTLRFVFTQWYALVVGIVDGRAVAEARQTAVVRAAVDGVPVLRRAIRVVGDVLCGGVAGRHLSQKSAVTRVLVDAVADLRSVVSSVASSRTQYSRHARLPELRDGSEVNTYI